MGVVSDIQKKVAAFKGGPEELIKIIEEIENRIFQLLQKDLPNDAKAKINNLRKRLEGIMAEIQKGETPKGEIAVLKYDLNKLERTIAVPPEKAVEITTGTAKSIEMVRMFQATFPKDFYEIIVESPALKEAKWWKAPFRWLLKRKLEKGVPLSEKEIERLIRVLAKYDPTNPLLEKIALHNGIGIDDFLVQLSRDGIINARQFRKFVHANIVEVTRNISSSVRSLALSAEQKDLLMQDIIIETLDKKNASKSIPDIVESVLKRHGIEESHITSIKNDVIGLMKGKGLWLEAFRKYGFEVIEARVLPKFAEYLTAVARGVKKHPFATLGLIIVGGIVIRSCTEKRPKTYQPPYQPQTYQPQPKAPGKGKKEGRTFP
ncbi:MAG: hypothetical protein QXH27_04085 [Candidatus Micrarchaeia archaeon]